MNGKSQQVVNNSISVNGNIGDFGSICYLESLLAGSMGFIISMGM